MASLFQQFKDQVKRFGLESFGRYYSIYKGVVTNDKDETGQGKVFVRCPAVSKDTLPNPAYPISRFAGPDFGAFDPPPTGTQVWLSFEGGDPRFPLYHGGWWAAPGGTTEVPAEFQQDDPKTESPQRRGYKTPGGHFLVFDDTEGEEAVKLVHSKGGFISIDKNGSVLVMNPNGSLINLDAENKEMSFIDENGNTIRMSADGYELMAKDHFIGLVAGLLQIVSAKDTNMSGANLACDFGGVTLGKGATDFVVKGTTWLGWFTGAFFTWLSTHLHPTAFGPSGPPVAPPPPPPPTVLSMNVKTK